ncbi:MAG: hypothetical protein ABIN25_13960 [Ginsengibacter sp.]
MQKHNITILLFASILCFSSCKKNNADNKVSTDTISASVDGNATTFNYGALASTISVSGGFGITIYGNKKDPSVSQTSLLISIVSPNPITKGTYVENSGGNPLIQMTYTYDLVFGLKYTFETYGSTINPLRITITDITSTFAKGTFSGEVTGTDGTGSVVKYLFTNGVFNVKF